MNRRQQINKILHDHIEVDKNTDYTNYKKLITAIEEWHEQQVKSVDLANVGGSYRMLKDGERILEGDEFIDHQSKWKMSHSINEIYTTKDYYPHRRLK